MAHFFIDVAVSIDVVDSKRERHLFAPGATKNRRQTENKLLWHKREGRGSRSDGKFPNVAMTRLEINGAASVDVESVENQRRIILRV